MNIEYPNTTDVELTSNRIRSKKPKQSWMDSWTQEERIQKFFEFLREFDSREDNLLKNHYHIFSHRLHWDEHPWVDLVKDVTDPQEILWYSLVFSFSREHWGTISNLVKHGEEYTSKRFDHDTFVRNDLFQIFFPKDTNLQEWILQGPKKCSEDMSHIFRSDRPLSMMEFSGKLNEYFKEVQGFRSPLYPCKNASRYISMSHPHLVDPESHLFGGTGHFLGLQQIFTGKLLNTSTYITDPRDGWFTPTNHDGIEWLRQMEVLIDHPDNPIKRHHWMNMEDKVCFFYKHISMRHSVKLETSKIPYDRIFPDEFELGKGGKVNRGGLF